jgi:hypothetical protein
MMSFRPNQVGGDLDLVISPKRAFGSHLYLGSKGRLKKRRFVANDMHPLEKTWESGNKPNQNKVIWKMALLRPALGRFLKRKRAVTAGSSHARVHKPREIWYLSH